MNPSVGHWIAPTYSSVYHGRADATDGSVWVIPRCHTIAGPYVVVHCGAPDGVVIRRIAVTHAAEAILLVDRLRSLTLRTRVSGIAGTLAPLLPRGSCILHGVGAGSLDASPATYLCAEFWALPEHIKSWRPVFPNTMSSSG